jgi:FixJ family two-component response regulator
MAASVLDASVAGPAGLGAAALADVLVLETCGLGDPEWSLVHRLLEASPLMEVVEISTDADVGQAVEELRSGVFAVFAYPVSDEDLAAAIVGAAARKRRAEERLRAISGPRARGE